MSKKIQNVLGKVKHIAKNDKALIELADGSMISTSLVQNIMISNNGFTSFETLNSIYHVTDFECINVKRFYNSCIGLKTGDIFVFRDNYNKQIGSGLVTVVMKDAYYFYVFTSDGKVYMNRYRNY